jgi:hypothetical protein
MRHSTTLFSLWALCASVAGWSTEDVLFGVGTTFQGTDFAAMAWGHGLQINFGSDCFASYKVHRGVAQMMTDAPRGCVPTCFTRNFSVERRTGVMHISFKSSRCEDETARVRAARFINETTAHLIKDTDVMYFETYAM